MDPQALEDPASPTSAAHHEWVDKTNVKLAAIDSAAWTEEETFQKQKMIKEIVMQIEVQYEDRYLKLPDMIKFKSGLRKIVINIPDDALEEQNPPIDPVLVRLYEMLGADYIYRPSGKSDKELLGEALEEKYSK